MNNLDFNYFCTGCTKDRDYREANCFTKYQIKKYKKGDYIAYKGDRAMELTLLVRGSVKTELLLSSGIYFTSKLHTAPYPFGALALFAEQNNYRADIVAQEECVVISVKRDVVEDQMASCRRFLRNFIAYNTSKVDMFSKHISILTHKNLKARLAFYILTLSTGDTFHFDKKLEALATYLCVERPSISRAIAQMVDDRIITYNRGEGRILNFEALRSLLG
ncbi:MAG: Crp/Fnr family transcriptional regulator [Rikenellaceae bacterium]